MQVGDKVYLNPYGNKAGYGNKEIREYEIKKIGRKYFEVWKDKSEISIIKFHLDNFRQVTNYTPDWRLYFSKQEILDEQEYNQLLEEVTEVFRHYGKPNLSLEQLRKIKDIISF